ncbi:hypothetical protein [Paenibacillus typhae]|uniref:hypothetical protein n=1 Tax=Paenibacillus typhae TaxID=1174501 RepID=UPI001C8EF3CE|nr:hypothetical protein [Paenibacillus typhae]MBY0011485.1 hypothetical protein [Paenibacillus typhae]
MIIKTTQSLTASTGQIVSGVAFRAKRERDGYRINCGEHSGIFVPGTAAFVLSDIQLEEDGRRRRGSRYD